MCPEKYKFFSFCIYFVAYCFNFSVIVYNDPAIAEPVGTIRSGIAYEEAARRLEAWFRDAMSSGSGPIYGLTHDLAATMLDLVDWKAIVGAMRRRED